MTKLTLSKKFIIIFVCILLAVFFCMLGVLFICISTYTESYIKDNVYQMQKDADESIADILDEAAYLYARITATANVSVLNSFSTSQSAQDDFSSLVSTIGLNSEYFSNISLILPTKTLTVTGEKQLTNSEITLSTSHRNRMVFAGVEGEELKLLITDDFGTFAFFIKLGKISEICNLFAEQNGAYYLLGENGYVVASTTQEHIGKYVINESLSPSDAPSFSTDKIDGKNSILVVYSAESISDLSYGTDYYLINILDYATFYSNITTLLIILVSVAALALLGGILTAVFMAKSISRPITALSDNINAVAKTGKKGETFSSEGDEIYQLEKNYDEMIDRIFALVEKNKEDMDTQRKLELDRLQAQINPHFLYNTLDAIAWLAKIQKQPQIEALVINLARFFRLSLHKGDKYITVAEEVELAKHYMEIEKTRTYGKIEAHFDVSEKVVNFYTLKLILQPVVENCLKYAFPDSSGNIYIKVFPKGEDIIFEVKDDGIGFEGAEQVLAKKSDPNSKGGFGLYNVNDRIKLEYGEKYGIKVISGKGAGTLVRLTIAGKKQVE